MKRVYSDIVGDLFHIGHINMFKQAREYGDYLIVGVHSDKTVESYKRKPIISENDRYEIIKNCKLVDEVITQDYIKENKIDVVIHGDDNSFSENYKVPIEMGIMKYVKYTEGISTTKIIGRINEI